MKKRTKLMLGGIALAASVFAITSCTKSFCSNVDQGRMLYAFDPGVTRYTYGGTETITVTDNGKTYTVKNVELSYAQFDSAKNEFYFSEEDKLTYLNGIVSTAISEGVVTVGENSIDYFKTIDRYVLEDSLKLALADRGDVTIETEDDFKTIFNRDLSYYSYAKFVESAEKSVWEKWDSLESKAREAIVDEDKCPSRDFINIYKSKMNSYISTYRTCLTTRTDKYGNYGYSTDGVFIEQKDWVYAWTHGGLFEGLLVYPIGWVVDQIAFGFAGLGVNSGWAALLSILFTTIIIRILMLLATFKSTTNNAKMTELQPEITKIQNKYPNSNTNETEKQRMASEMQALYKKHHINPLSSLLVMIIQFPVFICVWGALSGSAVLSSGTVLGLDLSLTIREVLFNAANWGPAGNYAAVTALFLFLLMALSQAASMLLPQILQKIKAKKVAKLGKNPAQNSQANTMKIFTYVMLAMIIFMGFSLVSAMGVYWFIGALISIGQTLITQSIMGRKKKQK